MAITHTRILTVDADSKQIGVNRSDKDAPLPEYEPTYEGIVDGQGSGQGKGWTGIGKGALGKDTKIHQEK
ncbi:hypothetical protein V491_07860 [Pseudogymnoascus sp. VKM F-3775]|nr:hypothetical protein V491_07860 [Pseudogymnoascus sp. VKM F-3775]